MIAGTDAKRHQTASNTASICIELAIANLPGGKDGEVRVRRVLRAGGEQASYGAGAELGINGTVHGFSFRSFTINQSVG